MRWIVYNFFFSLIGLFMIPHFWLKMRRRGGYRANFENRFGRYSDAQRAGFAKGRPILIHAVSVGEVGVAFQFIEAMRADNPAQRFVVSTTSSTGWKEAEKRLAPGDTLVYNPLDLPVFTERALDAIAPSAFIMVETEIWPNFIRSCARRRIPMCIVNGRLSDRTAPSYRRLKFWFGPALRLVRLILVQSDLDAARYVAAGANPDSITVTGSFKFDVARRNEAKEEMWRGLLASLSFDPPRMLLLGASTWNGEEKLLLSCYASLSQRFPSLRLALVPRHFERREAVEAEIAAAGFHAVRKSDLDSGKAKAAPLGPGDVLLGDTTGEIMGLYPFAAIAVVGRSFFSRGGQNMIEPCLCGVPTVVGPETQNFRPVMADLLASEAIVQVPSASALEKELATLLADEDLRRRLGERAAAAVKARRGVVGTCVIAVRDAI